MTVLDGRRIELWVEPRDGGAAVNPVMQALLGGLSEAGALVTVRVPEAEIVDADDLIGERHADLILLKSATTLALSLAFAFERTGVRCLNPAAVTLRAHDKAATLARLAAGGVPVPETWLRDGTAVDRPAAMDGAWVVKPVRGVHGRGVTMHETLPAEMPAAVASDGAAYVLDDGVRLVQRRIGGDEADVKVYVAGDRCFAAAKRFSTDSYASDAHEPRGLGQAEREVVVAVGEALGLRLFGVDLRYDDDGRPVVIDANPFPGYRGFAEAVVPLRREIERALEGR
jgi:ribosomal protein S6--L-glutamate ligase